MTGFEAAWRKAESFLTNRPLEGRSGRSFDFIAGIVGGEEPSKYSKSPLLWNSLFDALGVRARFLALDLPPSADFGAFVEAFLALPGCVDLTVTNPYKAEAFGFIQRENDAAGKAVFEVSRRVAHFACLNHLIPKPGRGGWIADNTDGAGLIRALKQRRPLAGLKTLLVGAGGAATSIAYELLAEGAVVTIANIEAGDACLLAVMLGGLGLPGKVVTAGGWDLIAAEAASSEALISAITFGSPLEADALGRLNQKVLLADIRYGAAAEFAALARASGRPCLDGREMLFGQFALAAAEVFGKGKLIDVDGKALEKALDSVEASFLNG